MEIKVGVTDGSGVVPTCDGEVMGVFDMAEKGKEGGIECSNIIE
jgi:hypothetical protein